MKKIYAVFFSNYSPYYELLTVIKDVEEFKYLPFGIGNICFYLGYAEIPKELNLSPDECVWTLKNDERIQTTDGGEKYVSMCNPSI